MKLARLIRCFSAFLLLGLAVPAWAQGETEDVSPAQSVLQLLFELQQHPHYWALRAAQETETDPARLHTLAVNIARWQDMPTDLGSRYLLVNIPAFEVMLWEDGAVTDRRPVIVGTTRTRTPTFSTVVTGVVLNPWWEIPASIVAESVGALVRNRPATARARGYVVENGRYRQRPGPGNALGQMKLVMPNPHSIGLHDTPSQALFARDVRAFSHGCVRVSDAVGFATTLLERDSGWTRERVDAVLGTGRTRTVELVQPLPIYVAYFTAAPSATGEIEYYPDIYRRDPSVIAAAQASAENSECSVRAASVRAAG
jgi:murein L,D-transpeptidase YcbB/YkuD